MKLDHLVIAVPGLDEAIAWFRAELGVAPVPGGRHEKLGTHNALLPLQGEIYVELIAADPAQTEPAQPRPFGIDGLEAPRLVTFAVRSLQIERDVERARTHGYDPGHIVPVSRAQPSGERLSWKLTIAAKSQGDGLVPFVIDWGAAPHPSALGQTRCSLEGFSAVHPDPGAVRPLLDALDVALEIREGPHAALAARICGPGGTIVFGT